MLPRLPEGGRGIFNFFPLNSMFTTTQLSDGTKRVFIEENLFIDCETNIKGEPLYSVFQGGAGDLVSYIGGASSWSEALRLMHSSKDIDPQMSLFD